MQLQLQTSRGPRGRGSEIILDCIMIFKTIRFFALGFYGVIAKSNILVKKMSFTISLRLIKRLALEMPRRLNCHLKFAAGYAPEVSTPDFRVKIRRARENVNEFKTFL